MASISDVLFRKDRFKETRTFNNGHRAKHMVSKRGHQPVLDKDLIADLWPLRIQKIRKYFCKKINYSIAIFQGFTCLANPDDSYIGQQNLRST